MDVWCNGQNIETAVSDSSMTISDADLFRRSLLSVSSSLMLFSFLIEMDLTNLVNNTTFF